MARAKNKAQVIQQTVHKPKDLKEGNIVHKASIVNKGKDAQGT